MRLLITTSRLESYGGSEIVVLELLEWFIRRGWHVMLLCDSIGSLIRRDLAEFVSHGSLTLTETHNENVGPHEFDLVWITHNVWPKSLTGEPNRHTGVTKIVALHMGSLEPEERAVLPAIENNLADRILVVSGRTKVRMVEFGLDSELITIFDNPVPNNFIEQSRPESAELRSVLCVSNHLPNELAETIRQLKSAGTHVTHAGSGGDRIERISPELLSEFDAVITIGKTTQYCLVMGVPVYSYDHFGGAGWLLSDNFAFEAFNNFTGYQTHRQLTADYITSEIHNGFDAARQWSHTNRENFAAHYSLDRQIEELLDSLALLD